MERGKFILKIETIKHIIGYIILFIISTFMISHSVNTRWVQQLLPNGTLLILLSSVIIFLFFRRKSKTQLDMNSLLPFLLLFMVAFLYSIINGTTEEIEKVLYSSISLFLIYKSHLNFSDIIKIVFVFTLSTLYMARGFNKFEINSLGIIFSFGIVGLINYFDYKLKNKKIFSYIILAIISVLFISLTRMRGAILAVTIIFTYSIIKELNSNTKKVFALIFIPLILILSWNILSNFFSEYLFVNKWGNSDFTTGRLNIWKYILSEAGLLGIGIDYIPNYAHAHNTLIHFVGRYGYVILPLIFSWIYMVVKKVYQIRDYTTIQSSYERILLMWTILSLTETIDFIKVPLYIPQFILLLYFSLLIRKEINYENDK